MELELEHERRRSMEDVREVCANGICMRTTEVEAKLDQGNIQEAEASLREGLSLNFEVLPFSFFLLSCYRFIFIPKANQM